MRQCGFLDPRIFVFGFFGIAELEARIADFQFGTEYPVVVAFQAILQRVAHVENRVAIGLGLSQMRRNIAVCAQQIGNLDRKLFPVFAVTGERSK